MFEKNKIKKAIPDILSFAATWMDQELMILSEVIQKQEDKSHVISLIYVESKPWHKGSYLRKRNRLRGTRDKMCGCLRVGGRME